jgi:hypothetical protein
MLCFLDGAYRCFDIYMFFLRELTNDLISICMLLRGS